MTALGRDPASPSAFLSTEEAPGIEGPTARPAPSLLLVGLGSAPGDPSSDPL